SLFDRWTMVFVHMYKRSGLVNNKIGRASLRKGSRKQAVSSEGCATAVDGTNSKLGCALPQLRFSSRVRRRMHRPEVGAPMQRDYQHHGEPGRGIKRAGCSVADEIDQAAGCEQPE